MKELLNKILLIFSFSVLIISNIIHPVKAQDNEIIKQAAMSVSPILNEIAVKPGDKIEKVISVSNLTNLPLPIKAYSRAFVATDEVGGSDYPDQPDPKAVQNWFKIDDPDFILQPKLDRKTKVTINVPVDARPGGHYATLFFESLIPKEVLSETSFHLSSRIGALFFFVVAGDLVEKGTVSEFKTNSFWQKGPVDFDLAFTNQGNVHLKPESTLVIKDFRGNTVLNAKDNGQRTLPEKTRRWKLNWNVKRGFGKYTATLTTKGSEDLKEETRVSTFWMFPLYEAITGVVLILILIFIVKGRRRFKKAFHALRGKETSTELIAIPQDKEIIVLTDTLQKDTNKNNADNDIDQEQNQLSRKERRLQYMKSRGKNSNTNKKKQSDKKRKND